LFFGCSMWAVYVMQKDCERLLTRLGYRDSITSIDTPTTASNMNTELEFLSSSASDLNLADAEDRAIFRGRVADRLKMTTVAAMREWVAGTMIDRYTAARAVADAYIAMAAK
jgi:hypothetical protein